MTTPPTPPQPPMPYHHQHVMVSTPPTSGLAAAALTLGIVGLLAGWCLCGVPSLLAVIFGHVAQADIKRTGKGGNGLAVAGLVLGYVLIIPTAIVTYLMFASAVTGGATTP